MTRNINVVGAVIERDGLILCAQRAPRGALGGLWEFPGGKIEPDEEPRDALTREIHEELACTVQVGDEITTTTHAYDFGTVILTTFYCALVESSPQPREHASLVWLPPDQLSNLTWAPADIPAVKKVEAGRSA